MEFGQSTGRGAALRSAISPEAERTPQKFQESTEPHQRGACFVGAVFDAYLDRFQVAAADLVRIATAGSGVLPAGRLHPDLVGRVTTEAVQAVECVRPLTGAATPRDLPGQGRFADRQRIGLATRRGSEPGRRQTDCAP